MTVPSTQPVSSSTRQEPSLWLWAALLVSLAAIAGSLYLSIGMKLKACPLCYYQRTFVMGVAAILVVGLFVKDLRPSVLSLLALPLAVAALAVAGYHVYLEQSGALECPQGILHEVVALGSAPQQSLVVLALLALLLILDQLRQGALAGAAAAIILGGALAAGGILAVSSACPDYTKPVDDDMCRPLKKT